MTFANNARIINIHMGKLKFTFTNIFLWLGVIASALLIENVGFLTHNPNGPLSDKYFFMLFAVAFLSYVAMFYFEHRMNKTKVDFLLLVILGIFLGSGLAAIWLFQDMSFTFPDSSTHILSFTQLEKIRFSVAFTMFVITLYALLFIFSKNTITARKMVWIYVILVGVVYFTLIYSLIAEFGEYVKLFSGETLNVEIKSLFWNTNMFSGTLIMGMCAAMIINIYKRNPFCFLTIWIFAIETLISCSVLSVIIAVTLILIYFLVDIALDYKKHPRLNFFYIGLYFAIITTLICVYAIALNGGMGFLSFFFQRVHAEIVALNLESISGRSGIWQMAIDYLQADNIKLAFGFGLEINKYVIRTWCVSIGDGPVSSIHNGVLQIFFNYGLVGISIYGLFLLYFFYALIRSFRKHKAFSITFALVGIALLAYSFGESVIFFNSNVQGLLIGLLFYLPAIMTYKQEKKKKVIECVKSQPYSWSVMDDKLLVRAVSVVIISLLCALLPFVFLDSIQNSELVFNILITIIICLGILWLTLPYLVYLWHSDTSLLHFKLRAIINGIIILFLLGGVTGVYFLLHRDTYGTFMYVYPIAVGSIMLIEIIYYSIIKKPSFRAYVSIFVALFKTSIVGVVTSLATILTLIFFFQSKLDSGMLKYIVIFVFNLLMFYVFSLVIMFKDMRGIVTYLDSLQINSLHRAILKDEGEIVNGKEN